MVTSVEGNAPTEPLTGTPMEQQHSSLASPMATDANTDTDTANNRKLSGFEFYEKILRSPRYVVAPMVDASELAWRLLSRRHGAQLCYSPMFHSSCFSKDPKYRKDSLQTCPEDRPLIIQFCGNDPKVMLQAALLAQDHCDAIDINLGCPQAIAKRGHYGAFLQDEWELLREIVSTLHRHLAIPVTCKIRIFEDMAKTIRYARMLQDAGAQLLTVHGRTREQKGPLTGLADWKYVTVLRKQLSVPLFSNGNIMTVHDVERCIAQTGVNGVMTAEGNLYNPALFEGINPLSWEMANEYLDLVERYPAPISYIRGHMFKLFHHLMHLKSNTALREELAVCRSVAEFRAVVVELQKRYQPYHDGLLKWTGEEEEQLKQSEDAVADEPASAQPDFNLRLPPWLCQPYIRIPPEAHRQKLAEARRLAEDPTREKRQFFDVHGNEISRKRMKKMRRVQRRPKNRNRNAQKNDGQPVSNEGEENADEEDDQPEDHEAEEIQVGTQVRLKISIAEMNGRRRRSFDELCKNVTTCTNPMGLKCEHRLCKTCCRSKCYREDLDCPGHKIRIKSRRDKAKALTLAEQQQQLQQVQQQQVSNENGTGTQPLEQHEQDVAVVDMKGKAEALS
ncbi:tRNA-dihydrouridine(16/17) synthase [NAD(P)(+)]-like [Anopheles albimanus]|uniref:tRNA-dihydrouridine(16/17) synthase [NAD(P)(+)]-like n=1 Tax=Anopheles albimanus TaxID=7167 RepID=UPI00163F4B45|nr:tRNA-dihydrouridine(16/17) synthase [NAD(P)(+)]-like [Anopheles albimanus]XP_035781099.1 tRNA-dihydrouridine(16/17) synthase [NAD(P)(+)]-like [Anopheles albimanus]XP_035781100.1 tRNA-dihydrouridine(16/17) synthase [NAD(P)(+)]-like [Anopheles albimanus]